MGKLSAVAVLAAKTPGRFGDGDGLFLLVSKSGSKSWLVRVQKDGRRRDIGIGSAKKVSLADARKLAQAVRSQVEAGADPVAERRKNQRIPTFREAAELVHAEQKKAWSNGKHNAQWLRTLETYAYPTIGELRLNEITIAEVRDLLARVWLEKNETARRVRQRILTVIDWAVAKGYREASMSVSVINRGLPRRPVAAGHFEAMPYCDVPAFLGRLRDRESVGRIALEAAILTATRSGEVRKAVWHELDLDAALWTIPAQKQLKRKANPAPHVIPLSPAAIAVFKRAAKYRTTDSDLVFPGMKKGKPLSDATLLKVLRDAGLSVDVHGFRSAFTDWASEVAGYPTELVEAALHHAIKNKVEAAYRRGNLLERRRALMVAWADYCSGGSGKVVKLAASAERS